MFPLYLFLLKISRFLAAIRFFGNSIDGLAEAIPLGYSSIAGSYCGAEMAAKDLDVPTFFLGLLV